MDDKKIDSRLSEIVSWLQSEFNGIRTGQAIPSILDKVKVESFGVLVPLNQVASINIENARTLRASVWDADQIKVVEKAIVGANLGLSVATDSSGLRVIFPELTTERRQQVIKLAKSKLEEAQVSARNVRNEAIKEIDQLNKEGKMSDDEKFSEKEVIQKKINDTSAKLEEMYNAKETEIKN